MESRRDPRFQYTADCFDDGILLAPGAVDLVVGAAAPAKVIERAIQFRAYSAVWL
jgi:hypothetical protein